MVPGTLGSNLVHFPDWTLGSNLAVIHTDVHVYYYITGSPCQVTSHLALFSWLSPGVLCDTTGFKLAVMDSCCPGTHWWAVVVIVVIVELDVVSKCSCKCS